MAEAAGGPVRIIYLYNREGSDIDDTIQHVNDQLKSGGRYTAEGESAELHRSAAPWDRYAPHLRLSMSSSELAALRQEQLFHTSFSLLWNADLSGRYADISGRNDSIPLLLPEFLQAQSSL